MRNSALAIVEMKQEEGMPRGAITEICGTGKTTVLLASLAASTNRGEYCAYVDLANSLDLASAASAGVDLSRLIWVRCDRNLRIACKVADILLHAGGFGLVCLDIAQASHEDLNRLPPTYWYRFRKAVENTPAVFTVLSGRPVTGSASAKSMECRQGEATWHGERKGRLLIGVTTETIPRKPVRSSSAFLAKAV